MKLSFLLILVFFWGNMALSQTLSDLSGKTSTNMFPSETPIFQKTKQIQNYNSKIKHSLNTTAKIQKQALDSLIEADADTTSGLRKKYTFSYDGLGRQTSVITLYLQTPTSPWQKTKKQTFTYNASGNLVTDIYYSWNYVLDKWVEARKWEFTYNTSGLITQTIISGWNNASHIWINEQRQSSTYDASLNLTQINYEQWNTTTSQWEADGKRVYNFIAGKMVQWLTYVKNSQNQIVPHIKVTYDFYPNDSIKSFVSQFYYPSNNRWIYMGKVKKLYDSNHDNTLSLEYKYNYNLSRWDTTRKTEHLYFSNHHHSMDISYSKDTTLLIWVPEGKTTFIEDIQGNVINRSNYSWNKTNSVWNPYLKNEFTIDYSVSFSDLILPIEYEGCCVKAKIDYVNQYMGSYYPNMWTYTRHYQYFFSSKTVGIHDNTNTKPEISISPNPSNGKFRITLPEDFKESNVEILNIAGKIIYQKSVQNTNTLNIDLNVPPGLYFIKVQKPKGYYEVFRVIIR